MSSTPSGRSTLGLAELALYLRADARLVVRVHLARVQVQAEGLVVFQTVVVNLDEQSALYLSYVLVQHLLYEGIQLLAHVLSS